MSFISDLFAGGIKGVLDSGTKLIEQFHLSPEQAQEFEKWKLQAAMDLQTHLEDTAAKDRDSARQREMTVKDHTPATLAYLMTAGFFGTMYYMLNYPVPVQSERILDMMLGSLGTAWLAAVYYYYGTSAGSSRKDAAIHTYLNSGDK